MNPLEEQLLMTLSHLEAMTLDKVFIDLDKDFVMMNPEISMQDLTDCLEKLTQDKLIKCITTDGHKEWLKVFPKRKNFWTRLINKFKN